MPMAVANSKSIAYTPIQTAKQALALLHQHADPIRAQHHLRYFKTGEGEYGHGDQFLGVTVPQARALLRQCQLAPEQTLLLLQSPWHEARLLALLILVKLFAKADPAGQEKIYKAYLASCEYINNWDLVDSSAPQIVGAYLYSRKDIAPIKKLVRSKSLWERRIAVLASSYFIKRSDFALTLDLAESLLQDKEDLIHKAVGWMLREIGDNDGQEYLHQFLDINAARMPRTMLRYAIEKLPAIERAHYLAAKRSSAKQLS
jgi:3-methyladenine DNA glycosylase AlkD